MRIIDVFLLIFLSIATTTAAGPLDSYQEDVRQILNELNSKIKGNILYNDNNNNRQPRLFQKASKIWRRDLPLPMVVIEVKSENDVALAVPVLAYLDSEYGIPFRIRSGGHHYIGYSGSVPNGICLSLSKLNSIKVHQNPIAPTVTFGPGTRGIDILEKVLKKHSYGAVLGACPTVAEGGFILGGGFSYLSRRYGMGCDNVLEMRAVLASGEIVTASPNNENSDLFWALRGAGSAGLAVVTEMKYKLFQSQDKQLYGTGMLHSLDQASTFIQSMGNDDVPRNVGTVLFLFPRQYFGDQWLASLSWYDQSDEGLANGEVVLERKLQDEMDFDPSTFQFQYESWTEHTRAANMPSRLFRVWNGFLMPSKNTKKVWKKLLKELEMIRNEAEDVCIEILLWGGKMSDAKSDDTSFPWRKGLFNIAVHLNVPADLENAQEDFERKTAIIQRLWPRVSKHLRGVYYNYPMETLKKDEYPQQYWGKNLKALQKMKKKYDPNNVFHHPQSIPLLKKRGWLWILDVIANLSLLFAEYL